MALPSLIDPCLENDQGAWKELHRRMGPHVLESVKQVGTRFGPHAVRLAEYRAADVWTCLVDGTPNGGKLRAYRDQRRAANRAVDEPSLEKYLARLARNAVQGWERAVRRRERHEAQAAGREAQAPGLGEAQLLAEMAVFWGEVPETLLHTFWTVVLGEPIPGPGGPLSEEALRQQVHRLRELLQRLRDEGKINV
jgi:hypothetical protein